ncbi:sensor histidine kinase [Reinekea blandensis]|uniref:Uncharacterized protein n=1 Tax=Reinekea blandensis MED297 TaxID=314283 RepID=A4BK04_9GAMM|nr:histidine kinase [Reinekea blandensis]EAR07537.1 hypothetical protein MED297_04694 [Reinekea sp. MED297] [Reinekea blandensis MED297]
MSTDTRETFLHNYFSDLRSIGLLLLVCALIAVLTHLFNQIGWLVNFGFSLSFGIPISILESFLRTRSWGLSDRTINLLSIIIGCIIGMVAVYSYLVWAGHIPFGYFGPLLFVNFAIAFMFSAAAFYFFWSQYRTQSLTLALQAEQLKVAENNSLRQQAENRLLQAQMEPHFLFNTLATVQSLIDIDAQQAKYMIGDLSNILRASMSNASRDDCLLSQELELVHAYLSIQRVRFGDRLRVEERVDSSLLDETMMPMLIQPLIENSVRHAAEGAMQPVTIELDISAQQGVLKIEIADNGAGSSATHNGHGLSLTNIRQRLNNRYGDQATLQSGPTEQGWRSVIRFPMQPETEEGDA